MGVKGPGLEPASGRYSLHTSFIPPQRADRDRGRQTLRTLHCAAAGDGLLSWEWNCSQLYDWSIVLNTRRWHSTVNWRHFNNNVFLKKKKKISWTKHFSGKHLTKHAVSERHVEIQHPNFSLQNSMKVGPFPSWGRHFLHNALWSYILFEMPTIIRLLKRWFCQILCHYHPETFTLLHSEWN